MKKVHKAPDQRAALAFALETGISAFNVALMLQS